MKNICGSSQLHCHWSSSSDIELKNSLSPEPGCESVIHRRKAWVTKMTRLCRATSQSHSTISQKEASIKDHQAFHALLWASPVARYWRICQPVRGTQVQCLIREDPTCQGAAKPVCHSMEPVPSSPGAQEPLKPRTLEPMPCSRRSRSSEKPGRRTQRVPRQHKEPVQQT